MKRYAGENGSCYASGRTIRKKLGIGQKAYNKSVKYLIDHNWIYIKGKQLMETIGGPQLVTVYGLRDLWKMNNAHYNKGVAKRTPLDKGVSKSVKGVAESRKGVAESFPKKNIRKTQEEGLSKESKGEILDMEAALKKYRPNFHKGNSHE